MVTLLHSKLDEIQTEPVVASVTRFSCVRYVPNLERFEFSYIMKFIRIRSSIKKERERYYALYLIIYLQQMGVDMAEPGVGLSRLPQNRSLKFPSTSNPPRKNRKSLAHWSMANAVTPLPPELLVTSAVATRLKLKARPPLVVEHSVRQ